MPKYEIDDDPAFAMNEEAKALAKDRRLDQFLAKIEDAEKLRTKASNDIKMLWRAVEKEGFDVREARQRFVRRSC